jgi:putative spermidine/putrescine transport system permease protein
MNARLGWKRGPRRAASDVARRIGLPMILLLVAVIGIGVPFVMAIAWSLVDPDNPWSFPNAFPPSLSTFQWAYVFKYTGIVQAIATSFALATAATALAFVLALPTAYAIGRYEFRGKEVIRILLLVPIVLPGMVVALFLSRVFGFLGLSQTFQGLILGHTLLGLPYMARLLSTSFEAIPREVSDAASNLGSSEFVKFREIYIPMIVPGILAGSIFTFIASLEEFSLTYVIGTPDYQTIPTILYSFLGYRFVRTNAAVVSLILVVPNLVLLFFADRVLRRDVVTSAYGKL